MRSVILAAGPGSRLGTGRPKVLLAVGGRTLLQRHLEVLQGCGPTVLVAGYGMHLLPCPPPRGLQIVENASWRRTGAMASLLSSGPVFDDGSGTLLAVHGDLLWSGGILRRVLDAPGDVVVAVDRLSGGEEAMKFQEGEGRLLRLSKDLEEGAHCGEAIGLFLFRRKGIDLLSKSGPEFLETRPTAMVDHFLNALADRGIDVRIADIAGEAWDEIDTPADLLRVERTFA